VLAHPSLKKHILAIVISLLPLRAHAQITNMKQQTTNLADARAQRSAAREFSGSPLFSPVVTYDSGGLDAGMVAVADLNGDGKPDLVVINCGQICFNTQNGGSVGVMLGNGDGTFQPAVTYGTTGASPVFAAVADVNGDDKPDVVVANRCSSSGCLSESTVDVLLGNGDGTFQAAVGYGSGGVLPSSVAVADVNGDQKLDVLVANNCADSNCDGSVGVLLGNGDGTFQAAATYLSGGNEALSLAVADLNGDSKPDVVVTTNVAGISGGRVGVLLGNGDGTFQSAAIYPSGGSFSGGSVAVADVNGDHKPYLVVENSQCCGVANGVAGVLLGNGDGTFQTVVTYQSNAGGPGTSVAVADINGDGRPDLIVTLQAAANNGNNQGLVGVRLGNGNGTFLGEVGFSAGGFQTNWVSVADVNGDGKPDLVAANQCGNNPGCSSAPGSVGVLLNNSVADRTPPVITLSAVPKILEPPNGQFRSVTISGTIIDSGSGVNPRTAEYAVKDEYGEIQPFGKIALSSRGTYSFRILLRAGRRVNDLNGRHYTIRVSAKDSAGNRASHFARVIVPHE